jgi:chromosome segregation ATPase
MGIQTIDERAAEEIDLLRRELDKMRADRDKLLRQLSAASVRVGELTTERKVYADQIIELADKYMAAAEKYSDSTEHRVALMAERDQLLARLRKQGRYDAPPSDPDHGAWQGAEHPQSSKPT